jgi:hypothetical protein
MGWTPRSWCAARTGSCGSNGPMVATLIPSIPNPSLSRRRGDTLKRARRVAEAVKDLLLVPADRNYVFESIESVLTSQ